MKHLVLIGDGIADFPLPEHANMTPLELAATPAMDEIARTGLVGLFNPIPEALQPGSDIGNLSLFGYDPRATFTGRAPLEAANLGISIGPAELAFRCNLVTLLDGVMKNFTSGHISTEEAAQLIATLNAAFADSPVRFHVGKSYRHLAIVSSGADLLADLAQVECTPPHDITEKPFEPHLPRGAGSDVIRSTMERSRPVLQRHPVNLARIASGKPPATSIWLWGQGRSPSIKTYGERFGISGAVISAVDLVNGIGVYAGLQVVRVPGATGYLDTNYAGKVAAAMHAMKRVDFVFLHVEAPDEASHEGRLDLKVRAIEDFDRLVVAPCLAQIRQRRDVRLLIAADHITALATRTHAAGPVPFALWGAGVTTVAAAAFSEREAVKTGVKVLRGHKLVPQMIAAATLDAATLNSLSC